MDKHQSKRIVSSFLTAFLLALFHSAFLYAAKNPGPQLRPQARQIVAWNFDWDDNVAYMPTRLVLFDRANGKEEFVSTAEYARIRKLIGRPGRWESFEVDNDNQKGTFRYFRDRRGRNFFLEDLKLLVEKDGPENRFGPSWEQFVWALSRKDTARHVRIITARGHSPYKMMMGLNYLRSVGLIKYLPKMENLRLISQPKLHNDPERTSEIKAEELMRSLDEIQNTPLPRNAVAVLDQDGNKQTPLHLWGFSDDDYRNYRTAIRLLGDELKRNPNRWKNVKINLFYTGSKKSKVDPKAVVLTSHGQPRSKRDGEHSDVSKILARGCRNELESLMRQPVDRSKVH